MDPESIPKNISLEPGQPLDDKPYANERLKFFSHKWLHRALYSINSNEEFKEKARGKGIRANFVIEDNPEWAPPVFYMIAREGFLCEAGFDEIDDAFSAHATYKSWVGLVTKELDPLKALITRKIRIEGLLQLMPMQDAFIALVRATRDDPVDY